MGGVIDRCIITDEIQPYILFQAITGLLLGMHLVSSSRIMNIQFRVIVQIHPLVHAYNNGIYTHISFTKTGSEVLQYDFHIC